MKLFKKKSEGDTRTIRLITVVLFISWSCLMLEAQINHKVFIQYVSHEYIMDLKRCFGLLIGYGVCVAPVIIYWIIDGFRKDENNKFM